MHWTCSQRPPPVESGGEQPQEISIPSLDLKAAITAVPLGRTRHPGVPADYQSVGWWRDGAGIGVNAPILLAGHVDDSHGPTVFFRLPELRVGAAIYLTAAHGKTRYVVDALRDFSDGRFPDTLVYGRTARPTLRLLTCSGFSWLHGGHYLYNLVVFAHQT